MKAMKSIRLPRFLENLYRDMRDRRLLLPAAALLVALIAVPLVLGSPSSTPVAPSPASAGASSSENLTDPAVLTEQTGVTEYRKRLDSGQGKDPFTARGPAANTASSGSGGSGGSGSSTSSGSAGSTLGSADANSVSSGSTSTTTGTTSSGSRSTSTSTSTSGSGDTNVHTHASPRLHSFRIAVSVGPAGHLTRRDNVRRLVLLPGDNRPLVSFIGVTQDAREAVFSVSRDVSSVRGDGRCFPRRSACSYLKLRPGDEASLTYAPQHDRRFTLKLRDIKLVPITKPHATNAGKAGKAGALPVLAPDG